MPRTIQRPTTEQDREFLEAMATDVAGDDNTRKRAALVVAMLDGLDMRAAAEKVGVSDSTAAKVVTKYNDDGWRGLLRVQAPRGGDFLARYDQGFWAERLTRICLDHSKDYRAIPYGTSRSEPFTDMQTFRNYAVNEFLLQAWSAKGRWKRPDLLLIPRQYLREEKGNDAWTPDLQHLSNDECRRYVECASAAIEVETSLWQVKEAAVPLSFTVKDEDLQTLRNWLRTTKVPLFIVQVFYDQAYVLPFAILERVIGVAPDHERHVAAKVDRVTKKATYMIPLDEGVLLGEIPEPDVEGRVFKAPNGKVTVYGRLTGSAITVACDRVLRELTAGKLKGGKKP